MAATSRPRAPLTTDAMDPEQIDRISRYASRIQRDLHSSIKLLQSLQAQRKVREQTALERAALLQKFFEMKQEPWTPAEFGFVLTTAEIKRHLYLTDHLQQAAKLRI